MRLAEGPERVTLLRPSSRLCSRCRDGRLGRELAVLLPARGTGLAVPPRPLRRDGVLLVVSSLSPYLIQPRMVEMGL